MRSLSSLLFDESMVTSDKAALTEPASKVHMLVSIAASAGHVRELRFGSHVGTQQTHHDELSFSPPASQCPLGVCSFLVTATASH